MGNSVLVKRTHSHSALAESEQRMRMVEIRDQIDQARVLHLAIGMAQTGRDLFVNRETGELEGEEMLDQKVRQGYISLLTHKLISNAQIPKEIAPEDSHSKWADIIAAETEREAGEGSLCTVKQIETVGGLWLRHSPTPSGASPGWG